MNRPDLALLHALYASAHSAEAPHEALSQLPLSNRELHLTLHQLHARGWICSVERPHLTLRGFALAAALTRRALETQGKAA